MMQVAVHNRKGEQVGTMDVDEQLLGGIVRPRLMKQAVVMLQANQRQGTMRAEERRVGKEDRSWGAK